MHRRLGDVLDDDGDVPVPDSDRFVVRRRDESSVLVDKVDRVDGSEMRVVLLRDIARGDVVLCARELARMGELKRAAAPG